MSKRVRLMLMVIVFGALMFGATLLYDTLKKSMEEKPVTPSSSSVSSDTGSSSEVQKVFVEDFTVKDLDGNDVKLSDFKGKAVVLNFWASWCGPCKEEMPLLQEYYDTYKEQDVVFMMVNVTDGMRETKDKVTKYLDENPYTFPIYLDDKGAVYQSFGAQYIPVTIFIDKEGYATAAYQTMMNKTILDKELAVLTA